MKGRYDKVSSQVIHRKNIEANFTMHLRKLEEIKRKTPKPQEQPRIPVESKQEQGIDPVSADKLKQFIFPVSESISEEFEVKETPFITSISRGVPTRSVSESSSDDEEEELSDSYCDIDVYCGENID